MTNLLDISKKLYESEHKTRASQASTFVEAAGAIVTPIVAESKVKTDAFISAIPADFNMAKVPPELRDKLKGYATNAKAEYSQAAKDAGRFDSTDPRYQAAVDKMNEIRTGFENTLTDITHLKTFRDNALANADNRSLSVNKDEYAFQDSILRGDAFADMTIGSDGISIMKGGEAKNIKDILENQVKDTFGSEATSALFADVQGVVTSEYTEFNENDVRNKVLSMFDQMKPKGGTAFAYDGLTGDATNQSSFIEKYITEDRYLGIKKYEEDGETLTKEYQDKYEELKDPANFGTYKNEFVSHVMETMRNVHDDKVNEHRRVNARNASTKSQERDRRGATIHKIYREPEQINTMNQDITVGETFLGFDTDDYGDQKEYKYDTNINRYIYIDKETNQREELTKSEMRRRQGVNPWYRGEGDDQQEQAETEILKEEVKKQEELGTQTPAQNIRQLGNFQELLKDIKPYVGITPRDRRENKELKFFKGLGDNVEVQIEERQYKRGGTYKVVIVNGQKVDNLKVRRMILDLYKDQPIPFRQSDVGGTKTSEFNPTSS